MNFGKKTVSEFLNELASSSPAPGGGSAAALSAAVAAALASMVANLTVGKEKYKDNWPPMEDVAIKTGALLAEFIELADKDTESFNGFMSALKMPKSTDQEKEERRRVIEEASKNATEVPLETLEKCVGVASLAVSALKFGNPSAASDAGCSALIASAAGHCAAYNVLINLPGIKDERFVSEMRERLKRALESLDEYVSLVTAGLDDILGV
jgi:glutamate formiminotransferase/formiminotetrahydrofolate cyclodeaminase